MEETFFAICFGFFLLFGGLDYPTKDFRGPNRVRVWTFFFALFFCEMTSSKQKTN